MNEVALLVSIVIVAAIFLGFLAWAVARAADDVERVIEDEMEYDNER